MLSLKEMKEFGVHQLCADLCKNMINSQISDGSEIKYLLPVKYIISGWNVFDSVEFKNPITGEEFVESWENEDERLLEEMNKDGDIDFGGSGRYFIYSEKKKEPKKAAAKTEEVDVEKELEKYKGLLDKGLITQEEYDTKRKQILGL